MGHILSNQVTQFQRYLSSTPDQAFTDKRPFSPAILASIHTEKSNPTSKTSRSVATIYRHDEWSSSADFRRIAPSNPFCSKSHPSTSIATAFISVTYFEQLAHKCPEDKSRVNRVCRILLEGKKLDSRGIRLQIDRNWAKNSHEMLGFPALLPGSLHSLYPICARPAAIRHWFADEKKIVSRKSLHIT